MQDTDYTVTNSPFPPIANETPTPSNKTQKKLTILAIALFTFIGLPSTVYLVQRSQETRGRAAESTAVNIKLNPSYTLYDPTGKPFPLLVKWDSVQKMIISGVVTKAAIPTDKTILISVLPFAAIPAFEANVELPKNNDKISTLVLAQGKFADGANWKNMSLVELANYLLPGRQVIMHIESTETKVQEVLKTATQTKSVTVGPLNRIIVGEFK